MMPFCMKCGEKIPKGASFCPSCGNPVYPAVVGKRQLFRKVHATLIILLLIISLTATSFLAYKVIVSFDAVTVVERIIDGDTFDHHY